MTRALRPAPTPATGSRHVSSAPRTKLLRRVLNAGVFAVYPLLLFAWLLPPDLTSPSSLALAGVFIAFAVRTFLLHIGLALVVVALAAWRLRCRVALVAALPPAAFCLAPTVLSALPKDPPPLRGETLTLMTANLYRGAWERDPLVDELAGSGADVLLLQEYTPAWRDALEPRLAERYPFRYAVVRTDSYGLAYYSRRPLRDVRFDLALGTGEVPQGRAVVELDGRSVALYNLHLRSPGGRTHFRTQRHEVRDLLAMILREALPHVIAGDFNFTNESQYGAAMLRTGLRDAHTLAGYGPGWTWPALSLSRFLPGVRIDHIYLSSELSARAAAVGSGRGSDHRTQRATIGFMTTR